MDDDFKKALERTEQEEKEAIQRRFNQIRDERISDLENGMKRVMGEYAEIVGKLTSLNAKYERLHFMLTGLPPKDTRILCKQCGKVLGILGETHECIKEEE